MFGSAQPQILKLFYESYNMYSFHENFKQPKSDALIKLNWTLVCIYSVENFELDSFRDIVNYEYFISVGLAQGQKSIGSMGALLPGRDFTARKVDHKQEIYDICIVLKHNCWWFLIDYWQDADLTAVAAPSKRNNFSGPGLAFIQNES